MKSWKLYLGVLVIFVAGLVLGSGGTLLVIRHKINQLIDGGPVAWRNFAVKRLKHELHLTPEQIARIQPAILATHQDLLALRARQQPEFEAALKRGMERIWPELTEAQRAKLQGNFDAYRQRLKVPGDIQAGGDASPPISGPAPVDSVSDVAPPAAAPSVLDEATIQPTSPTP